MKFFSRSIVEDYEILFKFDRLLQFFLTLAVLKDSTEAVPVKSDKSFKKRDEWMKMNPCWNQPFQSDEPGVG